MGEQSNMPNMPHSRRAFLALAGAAAIAPAFARAAVPAKFDLVIRGGRVIDPANGIDAVQDVAIAGGAIAAVGPDLAAGTAQTLDATGRLVLPGLIDIHTHATVDPRSSELMLRDGVTGWIETGWEGAETLAMGIASVDASPQKAGLLINIGRKGVMAGAGETMDLSLADVIAARDAIAANRNYAVGVKARLSRSITGDHDYEVLRRAKEAAEPFRIPVMIHIGDTYTPLGKLLELLGPGDIVTHMYAPPPHAIIGDDGKVIPQALAARERGVIFDWGNGSHAHVLWDVAEQAVQQGFLPDTISTDWTIQGYETGLVDMPTVMSNVLSLGVPLGEVVAMATSRAAGLFPLFAGRGTLQPGSPADVAVLELREGDYELQDTAGNKRPASHKFFADTTILGGRIAARRSA